MSLPTLRRYPGTRSFEDTAADRSLFTGRDAEIRELCQRIASHRVIVLYAPSGTGKSSLLRAGVYPELRALGYLPLEMRFSTDESKPLLRQLTDEVARECDRESQKADVVDAPEATDSFLHYFQETEFWGPDGPMAPVLVLDQFEEIFYLHTAARRHELLRELAQLIRGQSTDDAAPVTALCGASRLRLVLSLREEVVGQLAALGSGIPGLMEHAYRLPPLRDETAKLAITIPAGRELNEHYTPPFSCAPEAVDNLVAWLAEKSALSAYEDLSGKVSLSVESFVLQVFCEHIEDAVIRQRAGGVKDAGFTAAMLFKAEAKEAVLRRFYYKKLLQFLNSRPNGEAVEEPLPERVVELFSENAEEDLRLRNWRGVGRTALRVAEFGRFSGLLWGTRRGRAATALLERDLLTSDGRRQPRDRREIARKRRLSDADIAQLERLRLVRTEPHGGTSLLNLTHDQLAVAIHRHSIRRSARRVLTTYAALAATILVILASRWWINQERDAADSARKAAVEAEAAAAAAKKAEEEAKLNAIAQEQRATEEEKRKKEFEAATKELKEKRREASRLAMEQAAHANTIQEAVASLALAVKADPSDDEAFVRLVGRTLDMGPALPDRFWQAPGKARARVVAADPDGIHFAVLKEVPQDQIQVVDARRPWEQGAVHPLHSELKQSRFALGRNGRLLAALTPPRRYANEPAQEQYIKQRGPANAAGATASSTLWLFVPGEQKGGGATIPNLPAQINGLQISPGGKWLALTDGADSIHLANLQSGERLLPPLSGEQNRDSPSRLRAFYAVAFHPEDKTLAVVTSGRKCYLLDPAASALVPVEAGLCTGAAFSPDGSWLAISGPGAVRLRRSADWSSNLAAWAAEQSWTELAPPPHPHTASAFTRTVSFSPDSTKILFPQSSAFPGSFRAGGSVVQSYFVTDWHVFTSPFDASAPSTAVQTAANPVRRPLRFSDPDRIRAYVEQLAVQTSTAGQFDNSGRWLLDVVPASGASTLRDLTQALTTDQFPLAKADSMRTLAAGSEPAWGGPARSKWTAFLTPAGTAGEPPAIRRVTSDAEFTEWVYRPLKRLRPRWLPTGGPGRTAVLPAEGVTAFVQLEESDGVRVWPLTLQTGALSNKSVKLPPEWEPVNLAGDRWLIAEGSTEEGDTDLEQTGVWDMETGNRVALLAAPEGYSIPTDESDLVAGLSSDGKTLACAFENDDSLEPVVHTVPFPPAATPAPWRAVGQGLARPAFGLLFHRENPEQDTGGLVVRSLYEPGAAAFTLPIEGGVSGVPAIELHAGGQRLSVVLDAGKMLQVHTFQRAGAGWEKAGSRDLPGCEQFDFAAVSDDGQWLAVLDRSEVVAWQLLPGREVMLPRLPWDHASKAAMGGGSDITAFRFVPGSSVLALQFSHGRIALTDFAPWAFATKPEERLAFSEVAASLAAPDTLFATMRAGVQQANEPAPVTGFVSPADFLWNRYPAENTALRKVVAWLLYREDASGPNPFSKPEETLEAWRLACREHATLPALRDALEINPADPEALALYGSVLTKSVRAAAHYGAIMAAFHHAKLITTGVAAERVRSVEREAMQRLVTAMLAEDEPARAASAAQAGNLTDSALQQQIEQGLDKASQPLPRPEAGATAE